MYLINEKDHKTLTRVKKISMMWVMLDKLSKLYPKFADTLDWYDAHIVLADFCVPEELRNSNDQERLDLYYINAVSRRLRVSFDDVVQGKLNVFIHSPELKESIPL
jgi:hypothetical protein